MVPSPIADVAEVQLQDGSREDPARCDGEEAGAGRFDRAFAVTGRLGISATALWNVQTSRGYRDHRRWGAHSLGAEASARLFRRISLAAGGEVSASSRLLPAEVRPESGSYYVWTVDAPVSLGLRYRILKDRWQPYVGAEAVTGRYHATATQTGWAVGGRLRAGADAMLDEHIGLNVDLALGGWTGAPLDWTERDLRNVGVTPRASAGMVLAR